MKLAGCPLKSRRQKRGEKRLRLMCCSRVAEGECGGQWAPPSYSGRTSCSSAFSSSYRRDWGLEEASWGARLVCCLESSSRTDGASMITALLLHSLATPNYMQGWFFTCFVPCVLNSWEQLRYVVCSTFLLPLGEGWRVCMGPRGVSPSRLWPRSCPAFRPWSPVTLHYRAQSCLEKRQMLTLIYFFRGRSTQLATAGEQEEFSGVAQVSRPKGFAFFKPICLNWWLQLGKDQLPRPSNLGGFPHICSCDVKPGLRQGLINAQMRCLCSSFLALGRQAKQHLSSQGQSTSV